MTAPLHIALTFDDKFWAPAYATMRSIGLATRRPRDLVFHLVHWRLAPEHRALLDRISEEFGATLIDYRLEDNAELSTLLGRLPHPKQLPPIVYARLFLDDYLPAEIERFLFIDCDVYVRSPIEELFALDLGGNALAAGPEPGRQHLMLGDDMKGVGKPFQSHDRYFNAGVMLIHRAAWRAADLPKVLDGHIKSGLIEKLYQDQDILNLEFKNRWLRLDPLWNLTKPHPALRALDPHIIHYTTGMKPWNSLAYVAFGSSYKHVMTAQILGRYRRERRQAWLRRLIGRGK
jgi:lipopolysaccharide biosynthesis glycosyltransferase